MTSATNLTTIDEVLLESVKGLAHSSTPRLDAEVLLAHAVGRPRSWVLAHGSEPLPGPAAAEYCSLVARRAEGEPVAYLRGFQEWYGQKYLCHRNVLIPRPETELLLETAMKLFSSTGRAVAVDVGTGTGVLAVGLAREYPDAHVYALDISEHALDCARLNAERLGVGNRVHVLFSDLLDSLQLPPDLIVANLPYLSARMLEDVPRDVTYEPVEALLGGETGLEIYGRLIHQVQSRDWVCPMVVEIDPRQGEAALALFGRELPRFDVTLDSDYAGLPRIVSAIPSRTS